MLTVTMEKERAAGNTVECCGRKFGRSVKKDTMNKRKSLKIHSVK